MPNGRRNFARQLSETDHRFLAMNNAIWDLQQEVARLREEQGDQNAVLADHDGAITRLDNVAYEAKATAVNPERIPATGSSVVEPEMQARGEAWEQLVEAIVVYGLQGVTGEELAGVLAQATVEAEIRSGIDMGEQQ
jgi:hypothetical protein